MEEESKKEIKILFEKIDRSNHRGMIIISGRNPSNLIGDILYFYSDFFKKIENSNILYVYAEESGIYKLRFEKFISIFEKNLKEKFNLVYDNVKNSQKYLGKSFDILILDNYNDLVPDYLGRLFGIVNGKGLIIYLIEDYEKFEYIKTKFQKHLVTEPYTIEDVKNNFEKRFKRKIKEYDNIIVLDEEGRLIKGLINRDYENIKIQDRKILLPQNTKFSSRIYKLCVTQDQVNAINLLEGLLEDKKKYYIIVADRGRGKSAALGLTIAGIIDILKENKDKYDIGVTALYRYNVDTLFEFLELGLKVNNIRYEKRSKNKIVIDNKIFVEYRDPINILEKRYDFLFVDEAASIPINILYRIVEKNRKVVFSSTIHGYEGTGRSFSVRFLKYLKNIEDAEVEIYKLKDPIRYGDNDPIENFINDVLLLDAEAAYIDDLDNTLISEKKLKFYEVNIEEWSNQDNPKLKQFIGIYVLAHYQNRPNDFAVLLDAPHHLAFALELENGKIVCSVQAAREGNIEDSVINRMLKNYKPKGNIIPDVIVKHYRLSDFAKLRGIRIVRIATHFEVQDRGLGSYMLEKLYEWGKNNNYDWIGSSFGLTYELLNFWQKNGFYAVHLSPSKNKVSGEYSVIVLKPISKRSEDIIKELNYEFRWKILNQITDVYFDLEPKIIRKLLYTDYEFKPHIDLFTNIQIKKLEAYIDNPMTYEVASDSVKLLYFYYKLNNPLDLSLDDFEEEVLISKILLAWSFRKIEKYFDIKQSKARKILKNATKKLYNYYFK